MMKTWMNKTLLAVSVQMSLGVAYAAEEPSLGGYETVEVEQATEQAQNHVGSDQTTAPAQQEKPAAVNTGSVEQAASSALQQQEGDATKETNLEEVFTSNERQYSLIKQGDISSYYDIDYTYYRDTQLDLEMAQGQLYQLRVQENATHSLTNTFTAQYGLRDNLTLTASLPLVAKTDLLKDTSTAGLGDISFGARSRKYIDPVVLFASVSANYGFKESGLDQRRGSRVIEAFEQGISGGFAFGFAFSFNYDVSMTMSYQQSFNTGAEFTYSSGESYSPADQTSSTFAISLGVRVSPETIVNGTVGLGLTEDAPDVSLGLSFPLDILGFGKKLK